MEVGQKFNANIHIEKPVVLLKPSKRYFTLTDVSYELTTKKEAKEKPTASSTEPASSHSDKEHKETL